ncbi:enhancer of split malpha protein-like [Lucilia sericata]|uniref:enhancer of split malpha protein-like n=1 Tax=Lucilia sericata TaxID=13632 RepID=UPI0018A80C0A|nr:enhancer of split malpha protein-like [Lucilia sericata]
MNSNNISNTMYNNNTSYKNQTYTIYKSKVSPSRRLKNMLKPVLGRIFKSKTHKPKRSSYIASEEKESEFDWLNNDMDNMANEHLENRLMEELQHSESGEAIVVINEDGSRQLEFIDKDDLYVPVHFARTNAGTFFWTSVQKETVEPYQIEWNFLDRWAQA